MKRCSTCRQSLPETEFYANAAWGDRLDNLCKECRLAHNRRNREKLTPAAKERRRRKSMENWRKRQYGLSAGDIWRLRRASNDCCMACHRPRGEGRDLHIDHNHKTGEVRGILCATCNRALGYVYDSPERLRALADYLENPPARNIPLSGTGSDQMELLG